MDQLYAKCAGLDVHKESVVACVRIVVDGKARSDTKTFRTTTIELLALSDWLGGHACTHVAMEATGVYWKPVWHILEGRFELILANPGHVKNVPGRKTDVKDAEWLADLLAHGLIRSSFVPPTPIQELRDLTRTRKQLTREAARHVQRIHKVLEDANVKITSVLSNIIGVTGRRILLALIEGIDDPNDLVLLRDPRVKASKQQFVDALTGYVTENHRFLLRTHLDQIDSIQNSINRVEAQLGKHLEAFRTSEQLLITVPGIKETTAQVILAEIGADMSRFPSADHLVSWAGLCPRNDESAGKRRSTRIGKGAPWLKTTMIQAAWGAARTKDSYLNAQYLRLKSRRGPKKAVVAVAASMLRSIYHMLKDQVPYKDLGPNHFDKHRSRSRIDFLTRRIQALGYSVTLTKNPLATP